MKIEPKFKSIIAMVLMDKKNPTIFVFLRRQILAVAVEGIPTVDNVHKVWGLLQAGIGKNWNPEPRTWPGVEALILLGSVESRTQKNDEMMWQNCHICTKFQENHHIFGNNKKNCFETWQRHTKPGMWRFVTITWHIACKGGIGNQLITFG